MSKLSIVANSVVNDQTPPPMTDKELDEQIIVLLEDNRRLRHELKNKKMSYDLAMNINYRAQIKIKELEARVKMFELVANVFEPSKTKAA